MSKECLSRNDQGVGNDLESLFFPSFVQSILRPRYFVFCIP